MPALDELADKTLFDGDAAHTRGALEAARPGDAGEDDGRARRPARRDCVPLHDAASPTGRPREPRRRAARERLAPARRLRAGAASERGGRLAGARGDRAAPTGLAAGRGAGARPTKRYLLEEGTPVPFLVELGVMTPDGKVRKSRYDKFRQVNRFLELVDDVVPALPADGTLRVVDFGCGKSYLTFALHHLLTELRGREVELVGLDLKEDVIAACASLAERSGAAGLRFERGEIAGFEAGRQRRPRRQPARLRHRHRRGARAGRALGGGRDPRRPLLPEGGVPAARERTCCSRCCATVSRRSASPPSSPTRCARSYSSSPATGPSSSSSSSSSTRRRTSSSARSAGGRPARMCGGPTRSCATRSGLDAQRSSAAQTPREDVVVRLRLRVAGGAAGLREADLREALRRRRASELLPAPAAVRRPLDPPHRRHEREPVLARRRRRLHDDRADGIARTAPAACSRRRSSSPGERPSRRGSACAIHLRPAWRSRRCSAGRPSWRAGAARSAPAARGRR